MKKIYLAKLWTMAFGLSLCCLFSASAQVTTAAISGIVLDEKGEALPGATVVATHTPSGTPYGVITRQDGRYNLPNVRIGGPYTIQTTFVGYKVSKVEGVMLNLGQRLTQDFKLANESSQLEEVVVKADPLLNGSRTGAATNISSDQLRSLPTITRSAADFTRLTPMAGENGSFAGRNGQFNN